MNEKLNVLHCIHSLDLIKGGPTNFLASLSSLAEELDLHLRVLCIEPPSQESAEAVKAEIFVAGPGRGKYGFCPGYLRQVEKLLVDSDIAVIHGVWNFASYGAHLVCARRNFPYAIFTHGMLDPWFNERYPLKALKKQLYWLLAEYWTLRSARKVLFTSQAEMELAAKSFRPYKVDAAVIPYGILPPAVDLGKCRADFQSAYPELAAAKYIIFLGRITEKKGVDLLLDASLRHLPGQWRLVLAGPADLDYKAELTRLIEKVPGAADKIVWTGPLTSNLKWGALSGAQAMFLPSHQENFGVVVAESLACATPVYVSRQVNIWSTIEESGAGIAEDDSAAGVERQLMHLLALSESSLGQMRNAAQTCFAQHFDLRKNAAAYARLLRSLLEGPAA